MAARPGSTALALRQQINPAGVFRAAVVVVALASSAARASSVTRMRLTCVDESPNSMTARTCKHIRCSRKTSARRGIDIDISFSSSAWAVALFLYGFAVVGQNETASDQKKSDPNWQGRESVSRIEASSSIALGAMRFACVSTRAASRSIDAEIYF